MKWDDREKCPADSEKKLYFFHRGFFSECISWLPGGDPEKRPDILKNYYRVLSFYRIHMVCIVTCTMQPEYTIVHYMKVWYRCVYTYQHLIHFNFQYYLLFFSIYVLEQHDLQYEGKSVFKHRTIFPFSSYFCRPKVVHLIMFQGIGVFLKLMLVCISICNVQIWCCPRTCCIFHLQMS